MISWLPVQIDKPGGGLYIDVVPGVLGHVELWLDDLSV
jgi:hypothetical protein